MNCCSLSSRFLELSVFALFHVRFYPYPKNVLNCLLPSNFQSSLFSVSCSYTPQPVLLSPMLLLPCRGSGWLKPFRLFNPTISKMLQTSPAFPLPSSSIPLLHWLDRTPPSTLPLMKRYMTQSHTLSSPSIRPLQYNPRFYCPSATYSTYSSSSSSFISDLIVSADPHSLFVSYAEVYTAPNLKKRSPNLVLHRSPQLIPLQSHWTISCIIRRRSCLLVHTLLIYSASVCSWYWFEA